MSNLLHSEYLKYKPDTVSTLRKRYELHEAGRMDQAIDLLEDWIKKQHHLLRHDFGREVLEIQLILCKGMVERAKFQIDKLCTLRTLMPQWFKKYDVREFGCLFDKIKVMVLPQLLDDHRRIIFAKATGKNLEVNEVNSYMEFFPVMAEYLKRYDYNDGIVIITDYLHLDVYDFATKISLSLLREMMSVIMGGYGLRVKGVYVMSKSKAVDIYVNILKQVLSAKVGGRVHVIKAPEEINDIVPKNMWPSDYGGKELHSNIIFDKFREELGKESVMSYMKGTSTYCTDESKRQSGKFNEEYLGIPGSFRTLTVD